MSQVAQDYKDIETAQDSVQADNKVKGSNGISKQSNGSNGLNGKTTSNVETLKETRRNKSLANLSKPGMTNNPNGRPKGSRSKLSEKFLASVLKSWKQHGDGALNTMAAKHPEKFCVMVAGILPKDFQVSVTDESHTQWVINASPLEQSEIDWRNRHKLLRSDTVEVEGDQ